LAQERTARGKISAHLSNVRLSVELRSGLRAPLVRGNSGLSAVASGSAKYQSIGDGS